MDMIATTPSPPYYAVIFSSLRTNEDQAGYLDMAEKMTNLAMQQPGYLGHESAREGLGITVSYWTDKEAIRNWKLHADHIIAQEKGKSDWYLEYKTRICLVERDYAFENNDLLK